MNPSAQVTPSSVSANAVTSLALPAEGNKVARLSAKEFKASLPDTLSNAEKKAKYADYAKQFSGGLFALVTELNSSSEYHGKSARRSKTGTVTVTFTPIAKEEKASTAKELREKVAAKDKQIAELMARIAAKEAAALPEVATA